MAWIMGAPTYCDLSMASLLTVPSVVGSLAADLTRPTTRSLALS